jgi:hypothetical protein
MSATDETPSNATIQSLNRIFWLTSIAIWLWIVIRSEIWSAGIASAGFWINFLIFLAVGLGTVAPTHLAASALPLLLGVMALTAHDVKAGWLWLNLYVVAAAAIGFFAAIIKLSVYLNIRRSGPLDRDS